MSFTGTIAAAATLTQFARNKERKKEMQMPNLGALPMTLCEIKALTSWEHRAKWNVMLHVTLHMSSIVFHGTMYYHMSIILF